MKKEEDIEVICTNYVNIGGKQELINTYYSKNEFPEPHPLKVHIDKYVDINDKKARICPECRKKTVMWEEEMCRINPRRNYYCTNCGAVYEQILK